MTVQELINKLVGLPPHIPVLLDDGEALFHIEEGDLSVTYKDGNAHKHIPILCFGDEYTDGSSDTEESNGSNTPTPEPVAVKKETPNPTVPGPAKVPPSAPPAPGN